MERKIPKNVRQIGNVSDCLKIYVEDYVDTYLNQLCQAEMEKPVGAFLIGETIRQGGQEYQYIYGAVQMKEIIQNESGIEINDETWKDSCETCKAFFGDGQITGWFVSIPGLPFALNANLRNLHRKLFSRESGIFILKDSSTRRGIVFCTEIQ